MKLIVLIIRPERLEAVQQALHAQTACLLSVSQVAGAGRDPGHTEIYRGRQIQVRRPRLRLEIAADDGAVAATVEAVAAAAGMGESGQGGDSRLFVMQLDECIAP